MTELLTTIVAIAAAAAGVGYLANRIIRAIRWCYQSAKNWELDRAGQEYVNSLVIYHLSPNHGHSLLDRVHRGEMRMVRLEEAAGLDRIEPMPERRAPDRRGGEKE